MKRILSLLLAMLVVLSIFAGCTENGNDETTLGSVGHSLSVGFGRVDITPQEPVPLRGYGNSSSRFSREVADPLYATCLAFTDENNNTVLLYHTDLTSACGDIFLYGRSKVSKATGIPMSNIMISATHMHSGPDMTNTKEPSIPRYIESFYGWLIEAAEAALADRKPADLYTAEAYPVGYNFVRHYYMEDGTVAGDGFGYRDQKYISHVSEADNQLQIVKITREGAEDIVMVNWQGHPHRAGWVNGGPSPVITSDIVGTMRDYMEEKIGCKFAYFTGASGNQNQSSKIKGETAAPDYISHGQQLGQIAIDALKECKPADEGFVQITNVNYKATSKAESGTIIDVALFAFSIGDIGFVCAPYEMFDTNGMEIKSGSKYETTFVVTCANFGWSYIPSIGTYQYENTPEPYEVKNCRFVPGTGELLAQEFVKMLNSLYETRK